MKNPILIATCPKCGKNGTLHLHITNCAVYVFITEWSLEPNPIEDRDLPKTELYSWNTEWKKNPDYYEETAKSKRKIVCGECHHVVSKKDEKAIMEKLMEIL